MKLFTFVIIFFTCLTAGFSQNGVMDNFDNNTLDPSWKFNLSCSTSCFVATETNSELEVVTDNAGPAYENFEFEFPAIDISANPVVTINIKNPALFDFRIDLVDANLNATNATPNVKSISASASYVQYTFDFTGRFSQTTPVAATVDPTQITKIVFFVNPGGAAFTNTIYFDNLVIGTPSAPTAGFNTSASTVCTGTAINFTNTSSSNTTSYSWDFGTGATPATATTYGPHSVTWSSGGTKTVSLTVTGPGGTNTTSSTITVNALPLAAGSISGATSVCSGSAGSYSIAAVPGATSYTWTLPAGATIPTTNNTNSVSVTFGSASGSITVTPVNACGNGSPSTLPVTVNSSTPASVSITSDPSPASICTGTSVTFTATPVNGGLAPVYQWKLNGTSVGSNSPTYTNAALANNDIVTVVMTSNKACVTNSPATSNAITVTLSSSDLPSVTINTPSATVCNGSDVFIAAVPVNGGTSPTFVWKHNGVITGENNDTLFIPIVNDQDFFSVEMTAGGGCVTGSQTANSNTVTLTVLPRFLVGVSLTTESDSVCNGAPVTFNTTAINGGSSPTFIWKINGVPQVNNSASFTTSALAHKDVVSVEMTSNSGDACLINNPAEESIEMNVFSSMTSAVTISSSGATTCSSAPVTFTATPGRNAGNSPSYQWKVNGANEGTDSPVFTSVLNNNDVVTCVMTSSISCATPSTSNPITVTTTTSLTPSVVIETDDLSVCAGSPVTFRATPTHGGSNPTYEWRINGADQAAVLSTFTASALDDEDEVTCIMHTSLSCATATEATSNTLVMEVNPVATPSVVIAANKQGICRGTEVLFTADPENEGTNPTYLWKINGLSTGETGNTFETSTLDQGNIVTVEMVSGHPCASTSDPVVSNTITMTVQSLEPVSVSIASSPSTVCPGSPVTFTASPNNAGGSTYQWKLNGTVVGTNNEVYASAGLAANDVILCEMTSDVSCPSVSPAISNKITVKPSVVPTIAITADPLMICAGETVTFNSDITKGGNNPSYQWEINGVEISEETNSSFSSASIGNNDKITCILTSSEACATGSPVTSNEITITHHQVPAPTVTVATPDNSICAGTNATFTASYEEGGNSPTFEWYVNGDLVSTSGNTYSSSNLLNNNSVMCFMTSSAACASGAVPSNIVTMTVSNPPSTANAGMNENITTNTYTLKATTPASGTGVWTTTGGVTIVTPSSPTSVVQNLSMGDNVFTWTVSNGVCPPTSDQVTITLGEGPEPQTISGPDIVQENSTGIIYSVNPSAGSSYFWSVTGAVSFTGQGTNSITVEFGTDDVVIALVEYNDFDDYSTSLIVEVTGNVAVRSKTPALAYSLYPNPFTHETNLIFPGSANKRLFISIINMKGEIVYSGNHYHFNETIRIGSEIPSGLYAIQATSDIGSQVIKIHKE